MTRIKSTSIQYQLKGKTIVLSELNLEAAGQIFLFRLLGLII